LTPLFAHNWNSCLWLLSSNTRWLQLVITLKQLHMYYKSLSNPEYLFSSFTRWWLMSPFCDPEYHMHIPRYWVRNLLFSVWKQKEAVQKLL
jgi:hypothetical protein